MKERGSMLKRHLNDKSSSDGKDGIHMGFYQRICLWGLILSALLIFSAGCAGDSSGEGHSFPYAGAPAEMADAAASNAAKSFTGYIYTGDDGALQEKKTAQPVNKDEENIPREIVVLQKATAPEGYVPVPGAMVYVANNPGNTTVTDSAGKFTLGMDAQDSEADGKVTIIVTPPETLEKSAPIRHEIYPPVNSTEIRELFLSPAVQSITIGGVVQLYARATMKDGSRRTIDPSLVTWQVDNQSIAMVTPEGVLLGLNQGTAQVTISVANLRATGRVIIRAITGKVFSLKGTVTDGKGEPLSGVIIMILGRERIGISREDGSYEINGLYEKNYITVMAFYQGKICALKYIKLNGTATLDFTLGQIMENGSVEGKVTDLEGNPVNNVTVSNGETETLTDPEGAYSISDIPAGTYQFHFDCPGYAQAVITREIEAGETARLEVTICETPAQQMGILNGWVEDSSGTAVEGAQVRYSAQEEASSGGTTVTGSRGYFSFSALPEGSYRLEAEKPGYLTCINTISVTAGQESRASVVLEKKAVDESSPFVTSISPGSEEEGVDTSSGITVTFSENIDGASITLDTFTLKGPCGLIEGTVSCEDNTAVFAPRQKLSAFTTYKVTLTREVKDSAGNIMESDFTSTYMTRDWQCAESTITAVSGISMNAPGQGPNIQSIVFNTETSLYRAWYVNSFLNNRYHSVWSATSTDGISWSDCSQVDLAGLAYTGAYDGVASPVVWSEGGLLRMWINEYHRTHSWKGWIVNFESDDGINWRNYCPVLKPTSTAWEDYQVFPASVLYLDSTYLLYYIGANDATKSVNIGRAASSDGITITSRTASPIYPGGSCQVVLSEDQRLFLMIYSKDGNIYYARSLDGIAWENPTLLLEGAGFQTYFHDTRHGTGYLYYKKTGQDDCIFRCELE
ncbi:MAG: carboxypeptidase regulatory-like domain-containing protein [Candidatus Xenobiia bacterium LiM19]